jgi:N-acetylneuraminic acid mutarotase
MAKDKKGKSEGKKAKAAAKKVKAEKKSEKKEKNKKAKEVDSDAEDIDLDAVLAEYAKKQEQFLKVSEVACKPPTPRASSTIIPSPANTNELFLFAGEYFNGALATFFNDLYVYLIDRDEWRMVQSLNTPLPRSGHAWSRGGNAGGIYLFGGEFSSPKQGTFYHYNDFYRLEPCTREWTRLEAPKGKGPPARSGHRMTYFKNYIILFGGFQDTSQQTKYLSDLWLYDTQTFVWHNPALPTASQKPDPRSSFSFLPHENGAVLFGGYSRVKATITGKQTKGGGQSQRNVLKPLVHQDCWYLRVTPPAADSLPNAPPLVRWERRKKPANTPNPPRAGATMAYHQGRGIAFGGVHDVEESEEGIDSEFFNTLYAWNIERNRYFPLALRKPRVMKRQKAVERGGRRGRGQANEEELLRNLAALEKGGSIENADDLDLDISKEEEIDPDKPVKEKTMELPHPRFNAQLAVQDDVLYIYGGTFEKGDREYTFDEMYAIDLGKLDGVKEIFRREPENWLGSDNEESDDEEGSEDDDEDSDDEENENEIETELAKNAEWESKQEESSHKLKRKAKEAATEEASKAETKPLEVEDEVEPTNATVDDSLPHPRPFESRREFFVRTTAEWQEVLMQNLRWKGIQPESLSVKEIKTKAFDLSQEKWWDCREEINALEDEQEAAGIGEVVTLVDRGEGGCAGARRR